MSFFRKKPVIIEARQFLADDGAEQERLAQWCNGKLRGLLLHNKDRVIQINTFEGEMEARCGDWIIRGVNGEYYPCKPDIFEMTYEPMQETV